MENDFTNLKDAYDVTNAREKNLLKILMTMNQKRKNADDQPRHSQRSFASMSHNESNEGEKKTNNAVSI